MSKLPGARCDECPLKGCKAVPPERKSETKFVIMGEAPGKNEAVEGRPFIGASGIMVNDALRAAGLARAHAHVTNAVACYPDKDLTPKEWQQALNCCHPRWIKELECLPKGSETRVIAFGAKAFQQLTGKRAAIMDWFGYQLPGSPPIFPIFHPAAAMRQRQLTPLFNTCVQRAAAWLTGTELWAFPPIYINGGADSLEALQNMGPAVGVDVETGGKSPLFDKLLCVGVADEKAAVSLEWPIEDPALFAELKRILECRRTIKVFHNAQHDLLTLEANGLPVKMPVADTLLMHVAAHPGLRHNLSFACAQYFHAPRWKTEFHDEGEHKGLDAFLKADPRALRTYNAKDCYMGLRLYAELAKTVGPSTFAPDFG